MAGNDTQKNVEQSTNILPCLVQLLVNQNETIVLKAAWAVSSISGGIQDQIEKVLCSDVLLKLL